MFSVPSDVMALLALMATIAGSVWGLAWWLSGKFTSLMNTFYNKIDTVGTMILEKLEYHERHDDARFTDIKNDIWVMRVRNAARDGINIAPTDNSESIRKHS